LLNTSSAGSAVEAAWDGGDGCAVEAALDGRDESRDDGRPAPGLGVPLPPLPVRERTEDRGRPPAGLVPEGGRRMLARGEGGAGAFGEVVSRAESLDPGRDCVSGRSLTPVPGRLISPVRSSTK
jgi:hypothetical protein